MDLIKNVELKKCINNESLFTAALSLLDLTWDLLNETIKKMHNTQYV